MISFQKASGHSFNNNIHHNSQSWMLMINQTL